MNQIPENHAERAAARRECQQLMLEGLDLWRKIDAEPEIGALFARYYGLRNRWCDAFGRSEFTQSEGEDVAFPDPLFLSDDSGEMWAVTRKWWKDFAEKIAQAAPRSCGT